jgi:hypothetical protein
MSMVDAVAVLGATGIVMRRPTAAGGAFRTDLPRDHAERLP